MQLPALVCGGAFVVVVVLAFLPEPIQFGRKRHVPVLNPLRKPMPIYCLSKLANAQKSLPRSERSLNRHHKPDLLAGFACSSVPIPPPSVGGPSHRCSLGWPVPAFCRSKSRACRCHAGAAGSLPVPWLSPDSASPTRMLLWHRFILQQGLKRCRGPRR